MPKVDRAYVQWHDLPHCKNLLPLSRNVMRDALLEQKMLDEDLSSPAMVRLLR